MRKLFRGKEVKKVRRLPNQQLRVRFRDGTVVVVSVEEYDDPKNIEKRFSSSKSRP